MTGCQSLNCAHFPGLPTSQTVLPPEELSQFEYTSHSRSEGEFLLDEETHSMDHWLDLNA